jgi:hypothetical protein
MKYLIFFYLLFISIHIWGNIIHIPDDYLQIQAGIDAAADADTVLVHPGFYHKTIIIHHFITPN